MKNKKHCLKASLLIVSALFISQVCLFNYRADALTLSPPRREVNGDAGQTLQGELDLYNDQDSSITFYTSAQNFEARGETGAPYFLPNSSEGLASWITVEPSIVLGPRQRAKFPFTITIPQGTQPGGYFAAIFFGTTPEDPGQGGQVTIGGKLGSLILLSVNGDAKEGGGILDFISEGGNFFTHLPITLSYRFSNDGARKAMPLGKLTVKDMLGKTAASFDANPTQGNVLPGSIRKFSLIWDEVGKTYTLEDLKSSQKVSNEVLGASTSRGFLDTVKMQKENFLLGKYTADLNLKYGPENKTADSQIVFYVIPWQLMSLVLVALIILIILLITGIKGYNRWLFRKFSQGSPGNGPVNNGSGPLYSTAPNVTSPTAVQTEPAPVQPSVPEHTEEIAPPAHTETVSTENDGGTEEKPAHHKRAAGTKHTEK